MPTIEQQISQVSELDMKFAGTIAFKNEKLSLPDGSKVAIGIDGERWVILYQKNPVTSFVMFEYNAKTRYLMVDKRTGTEEDHRLLIKLIKYFFSNAQVTDVVTIERGGAKK